MSQRKQRIALWIGVAVTWGALIVDRLDHLRRIWEAPQTAYALLKGIGEVVSATTWFGWAVFAIGLACLLLATKNRWGWLIGLPLHSEDSDLESASNPKPRTDMPVWEVFYHLAPDYLDLSEQEKTAVEQEILDALARGQIHCEGRPTSRHDWLEEAIGGVLPRPEPISAKYWRHAEFTMEFFDEKQQTEKRVHVRPHPDYEHLPSYRDLIFNRNEVLARWPKNPQRETFKRP